MLNPDMPSLPLLAKTIVEVTTWSSCEDWNQIYKRLESLGGGSFPGKLIRSIVDSCMGWGTLMHDERVSVDFAKTIKDNERMRIIFQRRTIGQIASFLQHFDVDINKVFPIGNPDVEASDIMLAAVQSPMLEQDKQASKNSFVAGNSPATNPHSEKPDPGKNTDNLHLSNHSGGILNLLNDDLGVLESVPELL
jgi:hypothetical protein